MSALQLAPSIAYVHPDLGAIRVPQDVVRSISVPGSPIRRVAPGQYGLVVAVQKRPVYDEWTGLLKRMQLIWHSITHNERVDAGAAIQANLVFGTSGTTANGVLTAIAIATTGFTTKTKTDLSIGSSSGAVTTNEFTTIQLSRAAGTLGSYTAPASLGAQFAQPISKTFTATGSGTAHGAALFDKVVVASSNLYVEDIFSSDAVLVTNDQLTPTWTINN